MRSVDGGGVWNYCQNFTWATDVYDIAPYPVSGAGRDNELWVCGSDQSGIPKSPRSTTTISSTSGVWYSTNAGLNWQAKTMGDYNIRSIAVMHKSNNPYMYVATDEGEIYRSTNYGVDWSLNYTTSQTVRTVRVNGSNNYTFLATNNGVYRSIDEGGNWSQANTGLGNDLDVQSIAIQLNSNTIFAGTANSIYKSTNNGDSWTDVGEMNVSSRKLSR